MRGRNQSLSLSRRLVGRYLMFGLAGLFACIALLVTREYSGRPTDYLTWPATVAVGLLACGALVMNRTVRVSEAIEKQLRCLGAQLQEVEGCLAPVAEVDAAAMGWNALLSQLRAQRVATSLDERLSSLASSGQDRRWQAVFHAMQDGVAVTDRDGSVLLANNAFAALVGLERGEQAVGRNILDLLSSIADASSAEALAAARQAGATWVGQITRGGQLADGVWRLSRTMVLSEASDEGLALWTLRDITQQKIAEEMRNQFVYTATHELRTPLANIKAYAETLAQTRELDITRQQQFLNVIDDEATRLARFVDDLLNLSQIESGAVGIVRADVDLERLLNEVTDKVRPQAQQKSQQFDVQFPAKLPPARLDKDKFVAALINLLGNAVKYTPPEGLVRFLVEVDDSVLRFQVVDTGIGISAEELPRLGRKFFRSRDARVSEVTGSGLGLAFAFEVARLHGGDIEIRSELNKGSSFTLVMPHK